MAENLSQATRRCLDRLSLTAKVGSAQTRGRLAHLVMAFLALVQALRRARKEGREDLVSDEEALILTTHAAQIAKVKGLKPNLVQHWECAHHPTRRQHNF